MSVLPKKSLFNAIDSSSEDDQEEGGARLGINQEFAKRFEHNKKREERHRLEEKYKTRGVNGNHDDAVSSSSEESEDDGGYLATEELDAEISAVLNALKRKDPRIYKKDAVFYKDFIPREAPTNKKSEERPVNLKDYHRERYMKGDVGAEEEVAQEAKPAFKSMAQQDAELRNQLVADIKATLAGDEDEDWSGDEAFLKPKEPVEPAPVPKTENGLHPSRTVAVTQLTEVDVANADRDPDEYLNKFMATRAWAPESGLNWQPFNSDDEDEEDKANEFEHAYNMRFEDPDKSNEVLKTYSRALTASRSVRKEEFTGRRKQRQLESEKKEAEKRRQNEERARLQRLRLEEASDRLAKIKQAAGMSGRVVKDEEWVQFLDEAWDDDKWEEEMQKRFGEEYYAEAENLSMAESEGESKSGAEVSSSSKRKKPKKPRWDDEIDIKDLVPDFDDETKPDIALSDLDAEPPAAQEDQDEDSEADERPTKKRKKAKNARAERNAQKREARQELATLEALVNKKVELENPRALASGSGAGRGPGFRYRETSPNAFGLTARDILLAPSDAALNEFAGLKKLASFRDAEKKRKDKKRLGKKARLRQWRRETFGKEYEQTGPTYGFEKVVQATADGDGGDDVGERRGKGYREHAAAAAAVKTTQALTIDGVVDGERKKKRKRSKGKRAGVAPES